MSKLRWLSILSCVLLITLSLGSSLGEAATTPAGQIINLFGQVSLKPAGSQQWSAAQINQTVNAGDVIQTGPASGAAILCLDESQIKLNENTSFEFRQVAPSPRLRLGEVIPAAVTQAVGSLYGVSQGEVWLRNKNDTFRFELETPAATAAIRGTEFNLRVNPDGLSVITMLEGSIQFANPFGALTLEPGEEGQARPGQAPTKRVLVRPADAVQWSLYYPGIFSFRDIPLDLQGIPGISPPLTAAVEDYNNGQLPAARQAAETVLLREPDNDAALTLLGWISLQENAPRAAMEVLQRVRPGNDFSLVGLALARYRLNDLAGALQLMQESMSTRRRSPLLLTMTGYFSLLAGQPQEAERLLRTAISQAPALVLPRAFLTQIFIVQDRKAEARQLAEETLALAPRSPQAQLGMGLVNIALFQLPTAVKNLETALALDPRFLEAYLYLAKIWLGSDYLDRARQMVERARRIAPEEGEVLSMAGFIRLAFRDFDGARLLFHRAVEVSPGLGEPHLGLGIVHFRFRQPESGLASMLAATLLEPRISLYQSELGKALYQVRAFNKALDVYDYAKTLDPNDPTPHLYKGIALADLNRPGEAVQEINRSIALNDNRAIFRSRLGLNRDLAVRNYNLARSYNQLGLQEWATSKAVTAVGYDPLNSSAHLFLLNSYDTSSINGQSGQLLAAQNVEALLYRVLSPANQNTFNNIRIRPFTINTPDLGLGFDYTPLFEMPYARLVLQGAAGAWERSRSIQDYTGLGYGGRPGAAFYIFGNYTNDRGFRQRNGDSLGLGAEVAVKWEPTVKGTLTGFFQYGDTEAGDRNNLNDFSYVPSPSQRSYLRFRSYELSYVHRFNPNATLVAYYAHRPFDVRLTRNLTFSLFNFLINSDLKLNVDREFNNVQVQQQLVLGRHTFIAGADYFDSNFNYRQQQTLTLGPIFLGDVVVNSHPPERSYSFYLLDYWRLTANLLVELGLFKDFSKNPRAGYPDSIYTSMWSPRLGINYQINAQHTLRLALQRHLNTHYSLQPLLIPSEIAGFPWLLDTEDGSEVRQAGVAWEAQWDAKTFTVLRGDAIRVATPNYDRDANDIPFRTSSGWQRYQGSLTLNRILSPSWGLAGGFLGKRVVPDLSFQDRLTDYWEFDPFLRLAYLHQSGWLSRLSTFLVYQKLKNRADSFYPQINLLVGKELANKRGLVSFEMENLLDRRSYYALEPGRDPEFYPARRYLFKLALYF